MKYIFDIVPQPKPRMTQRDKWKNTRTAAAVRYIQYKNDLIKLSWFNKFKATESMKISFIFPVIDLEQRSELVLLPHQDRPDIDNLVKGFMDTFLDEDKVVWHIDAYKYYHVNGKARIEVEHLPT